MTRRSGEPRRASRGNASPTRWIVGILAVAVLGAIGWNVALQETADILVFKSSRCECCDLWVAHLRQQGFKVYVSTQEHLVAVRAKYGVPERLSACHTARAGGYTIEGHVPAADIRRLLRERPAIAGSRFRACRSGHRGWSRGIGTTLTRSSPLTCRGARACLNSTEVRRILCAIRCRAGHSTGDCRRPPVLVTCLGLADGVQRVTRHRLLGSTQNQRWQ